MKPLFFVSLCWLFTALPVALASEHYQQLWLSESAKSSALSTDYSNLPAGNQLRINPAVLTELLNDTRQTLTVPVPLPDGTTRQFALTAVQVMAPELAAKYPQVKAFRGVDVTNPANHGRFDLSPRGLTGMFVYQHQWVFLSNDPNADDRRYISYYAVDEIPPPDAVRGVDDTRTIPARFLPAQRPQQLAKYASAARANGNQITTYRIAISAAAEYTRANGGEAGTLAELSRLVNRVNQVFLTDLSIRFELVANNDRLIFTDGESDPFVNDSSEDLDANQTTIDQLIGAENYDLGHVLNTDAGGLATLQSICIDGFKAKGQSGSSRPFGDSFYIELVIHELGHQLAAGHTFNAVTSGSCTEDQRSGQSAVEPGSGSTIMSYAGICAKQNLQDEADPYFHSFSIEQIRDVLDNRSCGISQSNGNSIPVIDSAPINHTIPANTPFVLTAQVTDADNDILTYTWEQVDPGSFTGATANDDELQVDNGDNPLFRSFPPVSEPTRYFPRLQDVLIGTTGFAETYPTTQRQLNFELLVRDQQGGVNTLQASLDVEPTGAAFTVSAPQPLVRWLGGQSQSVVWDVANTDAAPISCSNVDILLDADADNSFESILLTATPNDGQQDVVAPSTNAPNARLMVRCSDNVFYALNPGGFTILPGDDPVAPLITGQIAREVTEDAVFDVQFSQLIVDDPDSNYPSNFSLNILPGANYTATGNTVTPDQDFDGTLRVNVSVNDGIADSNIFVYLVQVIGQNDAPVALDDNVSVVQGSTANSFDVLSNDSDPDSDTITLVALTYLGSGSAAVENGRIVYTPANSFFGTDTLIYRIEDPSFATATATLTIEVRPTDNDPVPLPTPPTDSGGGGGSMAWLLGLLCLLLLRDNNRSKSC